jgi:hypothetical protein
VLYFLDILRREKLTDTFLSILDQHRQKTTPPPPLLVPPPLPPSILDQHRQKAPPPPPPPKLQSPLQLPVQQIKKIRLELPAQDKMIRVKLTLLQDPRHLPLLCCQDRDRKKLLLLTCSGPQKVCPGRQCGK